MMYNLSKDSAPVVWMEGQHKPENPTNQNTEEAKREEEMRKKREEFENVLRKEQENPIFKIKELKNNIKVGCMHTAGCFHNLFTNSNYKSTLKEREELENSLRKEQERKTNEIKVKELKKVLELGGIHNTLTDSDYLTILTSDTIREKLLDLINPVKELKSEYLNCSSYYYNQETDTIFEIENLSIELKTVDDEVNRTLREWNKL